MVEGAAADLVVLDGDSAMLSGHTTKSLLDALIFGGFRLPIDRVMVNGDWKMTEGRHHGAEEAREAYIELVNTLHLESVNP
jgi:formimidoylglutamate deiminase